MTGNGDEIEDNWEDLVTLARGAEEGARIKHANAAALAGSAPSPQAPAPMAPAPRLLQSMDAGLFAKLRTYGDARLSARLAKTGGRVNLCGRCLRLEGEHRRHDPSWTPNPAQSWVTPWGTRVYSARCEPCARLEAAEHKARRARAIGGIR